MGKRNTRALLVGGIKMNRQSNIKELEMKKRIEELEKELAFYKDNCTIVWTAEDVLSFDDALTDEEVSWVLDKMERKHDATLGISWDTVDFWIQEVKLL